ncbi:PPC domain-containing protein [Pseudanabaena sp. 'Roaring Creek']|uniref:PPC domain-containing protein n=1 Tax=Pseudanabaena sp. 'Roaring Creek' TaxID=1681830 RepID=UPI0009EB62F3|nr:PPC domain-containing protein [Pseudanabaena sp. 'Roaring Creek']
MKQLKLFDSHNSLVKSVRRCVFFPVIISGLGAIAISAINFVPQSLAQIPISSYKPISINSGAEVNDILTEKDIPTGQKGFARDYLIDVQKDERLEITAESQAFDTVLSLLDSKGDVVVENDDASSETTNSLIFFKVRQSGKYTIRVSSFGGSSGGKFTLKVTKLRAIE